MTRIIAGTAGGRRLVTPAGESTRPTSDRVREALFSRLEALGAVEGARVLDLFAGSGALGLEAASRGAASVVLVDCARPAVAAARRNVAAVAAGGPRVDVVTATAARYLAGAVGPFDLALLDPPYAYPDDDLERDLSALVGALAPDAVVVVERSARGAAPRWPAGLDPQPQRRYGETALWTAVRAAPVGSGA